MKPATRIRVALLVICVAIVVGVAGAIAGNWPVVATMALAIIGQVVSLTLSRQRSGGDRTG